MVFVGIVTPTEAARKGRHIGIEDATMSTKQIIQEITFGDIAKLTDREIQLILREVDTKEVSAALKGAKEDLKERIFSNVSERVGTMIKEEMEFSGPTRVGEGKEAQLRILEIVKQLQEASQVTGPAKKAPRRKLSKEYLATKRAVKALAKRPFSELSLDEINRMFGGLAEIARREGILALDKMVQSRSDKLFTAGVRLAVDGTEPELIMAILETWLSSLMHEHEVKYRKVIEGIMSIQSGDNPRIVEQKLSVLY